MRFTKFGLSTTKIVFLLAIILLFSACHKIIEIDLPQQELKPVVNCLFADGEPFKVHLSLTKAANDTSTHYIENAAVTISQDERKSILNYQGKGEYTLPELIPVAGKLYRLSVVIPGYEEITAKDSIPTSQLTITSYTTKSSVGHQEEEQVYYSEIQFSIHDVADDNNYYGIDDLYSEDSQPVYTSNGSQIWIYGLFSNDIVIENEGLNAYEPSLLLFSNALFRNKEYNLTVNFYTYPDKFRVFSFSKDAFDYLKTWVIHDYTKEYDFWEAYEPIPMYSNIKNGYGIFAGYSSRDYEIKPDTTETVTP